MKLFKKSFTIFFFVRDMLCIATRLTRFEIVQLQPIVTKATNTKIAQKGDHDGS